ncbi:MAG: ABC transporter substrate-binding protein [Actinobacteria bacterium]|nr:ABC transporter substrate-binding protein [Actinomycetota bacterium]
MRRSLGLAGAAVLAGLVTTACSVGGPSPAGSAEVPLIGMLRVIPDDDQPVFLTELRAQGWSNGRHVDVDPEEPDTVAADQAAAREQLEAWLDDGVDLIVASSTPYAVLAAEVAPSVPTLFLVNDPVAAGLVVDEQRPEGNLTGVTFQAPADRTLHLAEEVIGDVERIGYLGPTGDPAVAGHLEGVRVAASDLGLTLVEAEFGSPEQVPAAVAELVAAGVDLVYLPGANATVPSLGALETELMRARLPVVANVEYIDFALLTLAPDGAEVRRQLARQAARILAGAEVASVPVEDPRRFTTVVDRRVAARLGLPPIAPEVLRRMDVVR